MADTEQECPFEQLGKLLNAFDDLRQAQSSYLLKRGDTDSGKKVGEATANLDKEISNAFDFYK